MLIGMSGPFPIQTASAPTLSAAGDGAGAASTTISLTTSSSAQYLVFCIFWAASASRSLDSATWDGSACTIDYQVTDVYGTGFARIANPGNRTANLVLTMSGSIVRAAAIPVGLDNYTSSVDTASDVAYTGGASSVSLSVTGTYALLAVTGQNISTSPTCTWGGTAGITEDKDTTFDSGRLISNAYKNGSVSSGQTVTTTSTSTSTNGSTSIIVYS